MHDIQRLSIFCCFKLLNSFLLYFLQISTIHLWHYMLIPHVTRGVTRRHFSLGTFFFFFVPSAQRQGKNRDIPLVKWCSIFYLGSQASDLAFPSNFQTFGTILENIILYIIILVFQTYFLPNKCHSERFKLGSCGHFLLMTNLLKLWFFSKEGLVLNFWVGLSSS